MSLTDYWRAGKLNGCFWCRHPDGHIEAYKLDNLRHETYMDIEVLAPCSYNHIVELTEKVKTLEKEVVRGERIIGKMLNESNAVAEENKHLRGLLGDCKSALSHLGKWNTQRQGLLIRINAIIDESEE